MAAGSAAYRRVEVETASPERLVIMLYNGAIRHIEMAKVAIAGREHSHAHEHLISAQEIVSELRGALDLTAGEIALNLNRIYEYVHHQLIQANVKKNAAPLDECIEHLRGLRDAWEAVCARPAQAAAPQSAPAHNAHGHALVNIEG